jgi:DNA polymerase III gamma/tau subunit
MNGKVKVYHYEECFAKGTLIKTTDGNVPIETIKKGVSVENVNGTDVVEKVFENKIPLDRVIKLKMSNGSTTYCSKDHLFLTESGWIKAINLDKHEFLCFPEHITLNTNLQEGHKNEMQILSKRIHTFKKDFGVLFAKLCGTLQADTKSETSIYNSLQNMRDRFSEFCYKCEILSRLQNWILQNMWNGFSKKPRKESEILFTKMCGNMENETTPFQRKNSYKRSPKKNIKGSYSIQQNKEGKNFSIKKFRSYVQKQSIMDSRSCRKRKTNKTNKWNFTNAFTKSWRKWLLYERTNNPLFCFGMAYGGSYKNSGSSSFRTKTSMVQRKQVSNVLQSGCRKQRTENSHRNRRTGTQIERTFLKRQKERKEVERIRVESIEVYQPEHNDKSFSSIIGNKERNQGHITFYDLQIEKHPSYMANGCVVHNCHQLTIPTQELLLDSTEEPPDFVYFIFCTTEPDKLKKSFKRRGWQGETQKLVKNEMTSLIKSVLKEEIEDANEFPKEVIDKIILSSDGSAGQALKLLDSVIDMDDLSQAIVMIDTSVKEEASIIDVCRLLSNQNKSGESKWRALQILLTNIDTEPEVIRKAVLTYLGKVMLNNSSSVISETIKLFSNSFMYSYKAGLINACYLSCKLK